MQRTKFKTTNMKKSKLIYHFTIYKEGVTDFPVRIMSEVDAKFDRDAKIKFYTSLNYIIT